MARKTKKSSAKPKQNVSALANAMSKMNTVFKGEDVVVSLDISSMKQSVPHIPTGALAVDYLIGGRPNRYGVAPCPGLPKGRILNLYGHEGSGKTTLALTTVAQVCATGGTVCYIDFENAIVPDYAAQIGVPIEDPNKFLLVSPETLEDGIKIMYIMLSEGVDLICIDSVGAGVPKIEFEKSIKDTDKHAKVGELARLWSGHLPKLKQIASKKGTTIIAISQIRDKIGGMGYGEQSTVQGGKAWKFYAALRMKLRRVQQVKGKVFNAITGRYEDQTIGSVTRAKLDKCKVSSSQGQEIDFHLRQGEGIDNASTLIDIAAAHGFIKKGGSWYTWERPHAQDIKVQGSEKLREMLLDDDALFDELWAHCIPLLSGGKAEEGVILGDDTPEEASEYSDKDLLKDLKDLE
jgi:recombination protein RecA